MTLCPELRQLRYFVALAEELHFARAARRLGIAQPALSQQLVRLEAQLGSVLVRRTSRRVELTDAGQALLEESRLLVRGAERAVTRVQRVSRGEQGVLRLGIVASGAFGVLPELIRQFRQAHRDVRLELHEAPFEQPFELLEAGVLDLAIMRGPTTHARATIELLGREPICAVLPADHSLARRRRIAVAALQDEPFILYPRFRAPEFYDVLLGVCRNAGFEPRVVQEVTEWQLLVSVVAAGLGVTLAPDSVRRMPREGVRYCALTPDTARAELVVAYDPNRRSPVADAFLRTIRQTVKARC